MNRSLVNSELGLFSYEILGLVGSGGAGAHDLLRMARRGRMLDWAGESQYYSEPKRLARLGYLDGSREPGKTRSEPSTRSPTRGCRPCRLREHPRPLHAAQERPAAPLADRRSRRRGPHAREHRHAARGHRRPPARLDESEASAELLPHRRKYLLIVVGFLRRLLDLHLELVDEVERELASDGQKPAPADASGR